MDTHLFLTACRRNALQGRISVLHISDGGDTTNDTGTLTGALKRKIEGISEKKHLVRPYSGF